MVNKWRGKKERKGGSLKSEATERGISQEDRWRGKGEEGRRKGIGGK